MQDDFGDRMKGYERDFTEDRINPYRYVYARIDGRSFSKFTRNLKRPYDPGMIQIMQNTTAHLVKETGASLGYTQSDEISLLWSPLDRDSDSQFMFNGKIQKLTSVIASSAAAFFTVWYPYTVKIDIPSIPSFDCRILNLPSETEAMNMMRWRQQDAVKNAVQTLAHHHFGHKKLMGVNTGDKVKMLHIAGHNFFDEPPAFRVGTLVRMVPFEVTLTEEELACIPEDKRPAGPVIRTKSVFEHPDLDDRYRV